MDFGLLVQYNENVGVKTALIFFEKKTCSTCIFLSIMLIYEKTPTQREDSLFYE